MFVLDGHSKQKKKNDEKDRYKFSLRIFNFILFWFRNLNDFRYEFNIFFFWLTYQRKNWPEKVLQSFFPLIHRSIEKLLASFLKSEKQIYDNWKILPRFFTIFLVHFHRFFSHFRWFIFPFNLFKKLIAKFKLLA